MVAEELSPLARDSSLPRPLCLPSASSATSSEGESRVHSRELEPSRRHSASRKQWIQMLNEKTTLSKENPL